MTALDGRRQRPDLDWGWIDAQVDAAPPMSERVAHATSAILFGLTPTGGGS